MKVVLILAVISTILFSCNTPNRSKNLNAGGYLQLSEPMSPKSLFPFEVNNATEYHIASQIHTGLVKYNSKTLEIESSIAKSWSKDQQAKVYTFILKTNYYFSPDPCFGPKQKHKITASDFKYTFELLASKDINPSRFYGTIDEIEGAVDFYEKKSGDGIKGIKVLNDSILIIVLTKGNPIFINRLADISASVLSIEAIRLYGKKCLVGAGAFMLKNKNINNSSLVLYKNPFYGGADKQGNQLPNLDSVMIAFSTSTREELIRFEKGEIDMVIGLPPSFVNDFLEKNIQNFQSKVPRYVLTQNKDMKAQKIYNLMNNEIQNFYTNSMNYIDLSIVIKKSLTEK